MDEKYVSYSFYISAFSHCSKIFVQKSDFSIYNSREKKSCLNVIVVEMEKENI